MFIFYYASALATAIFGLSVRPILMNMISQECLEGISSNLAQTSAWTQG